MQPPHPATAPLYANDDVPHPHADHDSHANSRWLRKLLIGGGIATAAIIAAPHLLPLLDHVPGLGTDFGLDYLKVKDICVSAGGLGEGGTGIAGWVSNALQPISEGLAAGGIANTLAVGVVGIGGSVLGHYIDKNASGMGAVKWGNVIRTAALLTSAFIALPAILPALGVGITFLAALIPGVSANLVGAAMISTLGTVATGTASIKGGFAVGSLIIPHLFTCGLSFGSAALSIFSGTRSERDQAPVAEPLPTGGFASRVQAEPKLAAGYAR